MQTILKLATKHWLRRYNKKQATPSVRAVLLGDAVSLRVIIDGVFSGPEIKALEQFVFPHLKGHAMALDIGANIGNHAASFSKYFGKIFAFEINEVVFHILQSNTVGTNIIPVHVGLSDQAGEVSFAENFEIMGASRIEVGSSDAAQQMKVVPLDTFARENALTDVSFVKIDVEGHELQVLKGGAAFFQEQQPVLAFEAHFATNPSEGKRVQELLESYGYSHFWEMELQSPFMRRLNANCPKSVARFLKLLIRTSVQKNLMLSPCEQLVGKKRDSVIASTFDLR